MGLAAASKGSASCRAGQCARCAPRPTTALPRAARCCPLPWLSPGGPSDPPAPQHRVMLHGLPGVLNTPGWRGRFSVSCRGGRSSELSHPGENPQRKGEANLAARRGLAGWAPLAWPPRWVPGHGGDPRGVPGREPRAAAAAALPGRAVPCSAERSDVYSDNEFSMHSQTNKINSLGWDVSSRALLPSGEPSPPAEHLEALGPGGEGEDGCLHRLLVAVSLAGRAGSGAVQEQGTELPEPFPGDAGGISLAWLLPISFTSGWNRWRGAGWKSPSGWESHKCVNKCDAQSLPRCPGNSGLSGGECQAACSSPTPRARLSGKEKLWKKKAFPRKTRARCHATAISVSSEQCND